MSCRHEPIWPVLTGRTIVGYMCECNQRHYTKAAYEAFMKKKVGKTMKPVVVIHPLGIGDHVRRELHNGIVTRPWKVGETTVRVLWGTDEETETPIIDLQVEVDDDGPTVVATEVG